MFRDKYLNLFACSAFRNLNAVGSARLPSASSRVSTLVAVRLITSFGFDRIGVAGGSRHCEPPRL